MLDVAAARAQFPALERTVAGRPAAYLDGPGGTQVPESVMQAITGYLAAGGANHGGPFVTSEASDAVVAQARAAIADFFNADPDEIVFGQNMTSLTLAMSRALGATWTPGDNVVVTRLDHDANVWPWVIAAGEAGAEVRWLDFDPDAGCTIDVTSLRVLVDERTRLVAITRASNAVGTIVDVAAAAAIAHGTGALVYVDAVHFGPHGVIDVRAWDCDFLVASAYKFFGPHTGCLYGKFALLDKIDAYKIRPAPTAAPGKWETGTQSFESLAGVAAAVDYLAAFGSGSTRRDRLVGAMELIGEYEALLAGRFLDGIAAHDGIRLYGLDTVGGRTPTFGVEVRGHTPHDVAAALGAAGIFVWSGHYYAVEVMNRLGKPEGLVRVGFTHYTTRDEVDAVVAALAAMSC